MFLGVDLAVVIMAFIGDYFDCLEYDLPDAKCI
jgi:hypothetical protein